MKWPDDYINKIVRGDCLEVLRTMPDGVVQTCVTSPPYWGLRDYGVEGQLGLEKTPEEYVEKMVQIFREVRRVLRDDGTLFLNLGDSYSGASCDTFGKEPVDSQARDYLCESLCGGCRVAYLIGKSRTDSSLASKLTLSLFSPNHENKESQNDHLPTSDSSSPGGRNANAKWDQESSSPRGAAPPHAFSESKRGVSSRQHRAKIRQSDSSSCPLCAKTLEPCVRECGYKTVCISGTSESGRPSIQSRKDISSLHKAYPDYTTTFPGVNRLKSKDLVGIPWRVAFALQADGWYLRSDIIWSKPNPMPESVTDRPTKAHEYIFLMSKSAKYYYDADAIREGRTTEHEGHKFGGNKYNDGVRIKHSEGSSYEDKDGRRNKRSVWEVTTQPFPEAHFATFPPKLIEPCILAGSKTDDIVLDPFMGSGTTALVAEQKGRRWIGIELSEEYIKIAKKRLSNLQPEMFT